MWKPQRTHGNEVLDQTASYPAYYSTMHSWELPSQIEQCIWGSTLASQKVPVKQIIIIFIIMNYICNLINSICKQIFSKYIYFLQTKKTTNWSLLHFTSEIYIYNYLSTLNWEECVCLGDQISASLLIDYT